VRTAALSEGARCNDSASQNISSTSGTGNVYLGLPVLSRVSTLAVIQRAGAQVAWGCCRDRGRAVPAPFRARALPRCPRCPTFKANCRVESLPGHRQASNGRYELDNSRRREMLLVSMRFRCVSCDATLHPSRSTLNRFNGELDRPWAGGHHNVRIRSEIRLLPRLGDGELSEAGAQSRVAPGGPHDRFGWGWRSLAGSRMDRARGRAVRSDKLEPPRDGVRRQSFGQRLQ
jgi:hypothetical protein